MQTMPNKNRPTIVVGALVLAILLGVGAVWTLRDRQPAETTPLTENPADTIQAGTTVTETPGTTTDTTIGETDGATVGTSDPTLGEPAMATGDVPATHVVKQGETLSSISTQYYNTPIYAGDIEHKNELENPDHLMPGTELKLPTREELSFQ